LELPRNQENEDQVLRVSAKVDYAVRALVRISYSKGAPVKLHSIAAVDEIPAKFLGGTLTELRRANLVESRRGGDGGFWLARPAETITVGDVIRAIDGDLVDVRALSHQPSVTQPVWFAVRVALERTLDSVTIADLVEGASAPTLTDRQ
jgi:Rrf2 family protein